MIKEVMIMAHERSLDPRWQNILDFAASITFLGFPHADLGRLSSDSSALTNISRRSIDRLSNLEINTFHKIRNLSDHIVSLHADISPSAHAYVFSSSWLISNQPSSNFRMRGCSR